MGHPILDRIHDLRRTARRLAIARAAVLTLTVSLLSALVVMWLDYVIRLEDLITRLLLTATWLGCTGYALWTWPRPILGTSWSEQSIAAVVERRFPELADRLSSALAFLRQQDDDECLGSRQLMRNVIAETTISVAELPLNHAIDRLPTRKALGFLAVTVLLVVFLGGTSGDAGSQALARLIVPWHANPWPRIHSLRFVDPPSRLAIGADLKLHLIDEGGRLPDRVELLFRETGQQEAEVIPMARHDDQMVVERINIQKSFAFRATGGDDQSMPWTTVEVIPPPRIVSNAIRLVPPGYTGWLERTQQEPPTSLRVLEETTIAFSGEVDRPLSLAELHVTHATETQRILGTTNNTGFQVQGFTPTAPCEYSLFFQSTDGTTTVLADRWSVQVIPDEVPSVSLTHSQLETWITARAIIPVHGRVHDDLGIKRVALRYTRSDESEQADESVVLYEGAATSPAMEMPAVIPGPRVNHEFRHDWSVDEWNLEAGAILSFSVFAEDYKLQSSRTEEQRLVVVTELELLDRAARRQSALLGQVKRHLQYQRQAGSKTEVAKLLLEGPDPLGKSVADQIQSAVIKQRQVNTGIGQQDSGILGELRQLTQLLDRSQIGKVDVRTQIEKTRDVLKQVRQHHLEPALRDATTALRSLQASDDESSEALRSEIATALAGSSAEQQRAITAIERLLDDMSAWDHYRRFAQDLSTLLRQQAGLIADTHRTAAAVLQDSSSPDHRAGLEKMAAKQLDLARRADSTLANMLQAQASLRQSDPTTARMLDEAGALANASALSGTMRDAGRLVREHKFGSASEQQQAAKSSLERMLDALGRGSSSESQRLQRLRDSDMAMQQLQRRQAALRNMLDGATQDEQLQGGFAEQEQRLAQDIQSLRPQLERLQAEAAAQHVANAASAAQSASEDATEGDLGAAQDKSQQAEHEITQARESIQQQIADTTADENAKVMAQLNRLVETLVDQQREIVDDLGEVSRDVADRGKVFQPILDAQREAVRSNDLVIRQAMPFPVFAFALSEVMYPMQQVIEGLQEKRLPKSRASARIALRDLQRIHHCLKESQGGGEQVDGTGNGSQEGTGQSPGGTQDATFQLAQLYLIRELQLRINEETIQSAETGTEDVRDDDVTALARRQGRLKTLLSQLGKTSQEPKQ